MSVERSRGMQRGTKETEFLFFENPGQVMISPFRTCEMVRRLSRGTSEIECGHISDPDKKENVMKELLKFIAVR